jgi:hypothetical protein
MARVAGAVFGPTILKGQFFNLMKEKITSTSCDFYPWSFSLITLSIISTQKGPAFPQLCLTLYQKKTSSSEVLVTPKRLRYLSLYENL